MLLWQKRAPNAFGFLRNAAGIPHWSHQDGGFDAAFGGRSVGSEAAGLKTERLYVAARASVDFATSDEG